MKLFGSMNRRSFNTLKIRAALAEAGADYEFVPVDIPKGQNRTPEFLAMNPHGKVPVLLDDDGFVLAESDAILWYVAEKFPASRLLPARDDIQTRARVLQWCDFASTGLYAAYVEWSGLGKGTDPEKRVPAIADGALGKIDRALVVLETVLGGREFVAGPFSIADLSIAAIIQTLKQKMTADPIAARDHTRAWYGRVTERPAWKSAAGV